MPLIIINNSLGGGDTHTYTNTQTNLPDKRKFKKLVMLACLQLACMTGLK